MDSKTRTIKAQYPGSCPACFGAIQIGEMIEYAKGIKVRHATCPESTIVAKADSGICRKCGTVCYGDCQS